MQKRQLARSRGGATLAAVAVLVASAGGKNREFRANFNAIVASSLQQWREKNSTTMRSRAMRHLPIYGMVRRSRVRHRNNISPPPPPKSSTRPKSPSSPDGSPPKKNPIPSRPAAAKKPLRRSSHPLPYTPHPSPQCSRAPKFPATPKSPPISPLPNRRQRAHHGLNA